MAPRDQQNLTISERMGMLAENGLFKLYERSLIAIGMPAMLALVGWGLVTIVQLETDMAQATTIQSEILVPGMQQLQQVAIADAQNNFTKEDAERLEDHLQGQIDELRRNIHELSKIVINRDMQP